MQRMMQGHYWTVAPWFRQILRPTLPPPFAPFSAHVDESPAGPVRVLGKLSHRRDAKSLAVIVHGLGGNDGSYYAIEAAAWADRFGHACLRINMRGAGGDGADIYHASLYSDLHTALGSPELDRYERIFILGYSLGGHISLRYASSGSLDPRVRAVAAICAPLDLDCAVTAIDQPERWVYRKVVLAGLKDMYRAAAARRPMPLPVRDALAINSMREWDRLIMTRRFGYPSAEAYYAQESVAPRLRDLSVPTLLLVADADPMVPPAALGSAFAEHSRSPLLEVRKIPIGGHVGFPSGLQLGFGDMTGLGPQVMHWLQRQ